MAPVLPTWFVESGLDAPFCAFYLFFFLGESRLVLEAILRYQPLGCKFPNHTSPFSFLIWFERETNQTPSLGGLPDRQFGKSSSLFRWWSRSSEQNENTQCGTHPLKETISGMVFWGSVPFSLPIERGNDPEINHPTGGFVYSETTKTDSFNQPRAHSISHSLHSLRQTWKLPTLACVNGLSILHFGVRSGASMQSSGGYLLWMVAKSFLHQEPLEQWFPSENSVTNLMVSFNHVCRVSSRGAHSTLPQTIGAIKLVQLAISFSSSLLL